MVAHALIALVMAVHFLLLLFLVVGGFLAWRWHGVLYPHVAMAAWGFFVTAFPISCPLTAVENALRARAGAPVLTTGFVDTYIDGVLYPESVTGVVQLLVALLVAGSWAGYFLRVRGERRSASRQVGAH